MPIDILTRGEKGSNLTPSEADNDLLILQNGINALENGSATSVIAAGTNAYTATIGPVPVFGTTIRVKIGTTSTGPSTLNGKKIYKTTSLQADISDLVIGNIYQMTYDSALDSGNGGWFRYPGAITVYEEKYSGQNVLLYSSLYVQAVSILSVSLSPEISQILYSLNGAAFQSFTFPVAIPANASVIYKVVYANESVQFGSFIVRYS